MRGVLTQLKAERELTFGEFAAIYKQRHVQAKGLAIGRTTDYRLKPLIQKRSLTNRSPRFGQRTLKTSSPTSRSLAW